MATTIFQDRVGYYTITASYHDGFGTIPSRVDLDVTDRSAFGPRVFNVASRTILRHVAGKRVVWSYGATIYGTRRDACLAAVAAMVRPDGERFDRVPASVWVDFLSDVPSVQPIPYLSRVRTGGFFQVLDARR